MRDRDVDLVLDVGGNTGEWAQLLRRSGYEGEIVSFEPVQEAFEQLRRRADADPNWTCQQVAVGDADGEASIGVSENLGSSSLLSVNSRHIGADPRSKFVQTETVAVRTLDTLLSGSSTGRRIYLKLDIQGYEIKALEGARRTLDDVEVVQLEVSLVPLYDGEPLWSEVLSTVEGLGFEPFSLDACFSDPGSGQMLQMDAIFVRAGRAWVKTGTM